MRKRGTCYTVLVSRGHHQTMGEAEDPAEAFFRALEQHRYLVYQVPSCS